MRISPALRIALGLASLTAFVVLLADLFFGVVSDPMRGTLETRRQVSENLAIQLAATIPGDPAVVRQTINFMVRRNPDILSIAVRRIDGNIAAESGDHTRHWKKLENDHSTANHIAVPMYLGDRRWGSVEISFREARSNSLSAWAELPIARFMIFLGLAGSLAYYLFMRRMLHHLDPSRVIPDRVRSAMDALTEGVAFIDQNGRIVLANESFRELHGGTADAVNGKRASDLAWLTAGLDKDPAKHPWARSMRERRKIMGVVVSVTVGDGPRRKAILNCAPILDGKDKVRGCIASFSDVTRLHQANRKLQHTLTKLQVSQAEIAKRNEELRASQEEIARQNEELKNLATRDPLTGCLNRRAFFADIEKLTAEHAGKRLAVSFVMSDIDHFKSFNDKYGHAVGDQVIQQVARSLGKSIRAHDLLCRWGGEEFCIMLFSLDIDGAFTVGERIRATVEHEAGPSIRTTPGLRVTGSVGVATGILGESDPEKLIEQADEALYAAKRTGRNRVVRFDAMPVVESESKAA